MLNDSFNTMDRVSKENRMRNIIASKARGISEKNVDRILAAIDIDKQYAVTGSRYYDSLLRNAYEEYSTGKYQVKIITIYGTLSPGLIKPGIIVTAPTADDMPTAFIKNIKIYKNGRTFCQDSIFIYQNRLFQPWRDYNELVS